MLTHYAVVVIEDREPSSSYTRRLHCSKMSYPLFFAYPQLNLIIVSLSAALLDSPTFCMLPVPVGCTNTNPHVLAASFYSSYGQSHACVAPRGELYANQDPVDFSLPCQSGTSGVLWDNGMSLAGDRFTSSNTS
ncbi:hypothetical protein BD311DRAFT_772332, partial [Dichomitus squalens]